MIGRRLLFIALSISQILLLIMDIKMKLPLLQTSCSTVLKPTGSYKGDREVLLKKLLSLFQSHFLNSEKFKFHLATMRPRMFFVSNHVDSEIRSARFCLSMMKIVSFGSITWKVLSKKIVASIWKEKKYWYQWKPSLILRKVFCSR